MGSFFFCNKSGEKYPSEYLPFVVSKLDKRFELTSCTFGSTADKKNTLRNQLLEAGMKNCVTVENSYFGYWEEKMPKMYNEDSFASITHSILKTLYFMLVEENNDKLPLSCRFSFSR
jgi:hypothetical protein